MDGYVLAQARSQCFYPRFERKPESPESTHYCPGCGHGILHKLIARVLDEFGVQDRTVFVSPVGCSVFAYYYFDLGHVQAAHGRASAVATAIKRTRPDSVVLCYQGDGDLAAIGTAEILHAANRGEPFTVFFVNNAIYGMTGGQAAPTTPLAAVSTTTPYGRSALNDGYPLKMAELLASLEAPVYVERVALGNGKQITAAWRAIRTAIDVQRRGLGFSFIEVLSPCPTVWKLTPVEAQKRVRDELTKVFPLGVKCDRRRQTVPRSQPPAALPADQVEVLLRGAEAEGEWPHPLACQPVDVRLKIAGFGGQGIQLLGEVIAQAGMYAGLHVSWLPSYGPEMRSGTSNASVRLSTNEVDSPVVSRPTHLIALNEPSLRKFLASVEPGGMVFYNNESFPTDCVRSDLELVAVPFTQQADRLGDPRVANMVALGAWLERVPCLPDGALELALKAHVKSESLIALNREAIQQGRLLCAQRRYRT
ncbi:MAG: 2-oxoacid:acceptor oxidoreductase family protein [Bryobacteraceae bacterium]|nr:2-oxoacid:acceptor oxidoreductase family protein [Bryobacteraceae bacterium]MDW8380003.1 2-oxoacid:acceptor oxidoreductase family protein [Bryobacterales bacterium]